MRTSPATAAQLQYVQDSLRDFREHWRSFSHMPFAGDFNGTFDDIRALDYLDYEGLGYPPSDLTGAALVWGNVLACQLEMVWVTDHVGHLLLKHHSPGNDIAVWPYARVLEVQERSLPQFRRYAWLLHSVVQDCLAHGDLSDRARIWAVQMLIAAAPE